MADDLTSTPKPIKLLLCANDKSNRGLSVHPWTKAEGQPNQAPFISFFLVGLYPGTAAKNDTLIWYLQPSSLATLSSPTPC